MSDLKNNLIPISFVNAFSSKDVSRTVEKSLNMLYGRRIGVVTTAQHIQMLETVKKILKRHKFIPVISDGDGRIYKKGQILGCNFSAGLKIADEVDSFLFVGSGTFHPVGLLLSSKKQ